MMGYQHLFHFGNRMMALHRILSSSVSSTVGFLSRFLDPYHQMKMLLGYLFMFLKVATNVKSCLGG